MKRIATLLAMATWTASITGFSLYLRENIASGDDHSNASKANRLLNQRLASEFSALECGDLESRYEVRKDAVYFHVHNWRHKCKESVVRKLAEAAAQEVYGIPRLAIHVKFHDANVN
jgi:hypothetical protein